MMKLKLYSILMAATVCMAGCSDDNDPVTTNPVEDIAGAYKGYTVAEFQYSPIPMTTAGESFSLTANQDGTGTISFKSDTWGTFTISDADVALKSDNYTIAGSGKTVMGMEAESQKEYECTVEGTVSKDKQSVSLVFNVPAVMGGLKLTFNAGDAPAAMAIAGKYEGLLDLAVMGNSVADYEKFGVTIKTQADGKAEISLDDFSYGASMNFTDFVIADVEVSVSNDVYTLEGKIDTTAGTSLVVTGSLAGTVTDGKANLVFTMKPGSMPLDIVATFTSN